MENQPQAAPSGSKSTMWILILVVVIIVAGGAYYFLSQDDGTNTNSTNNANAVVNSVSNANENANTNTDQLEVTDSTLYADWYQLVNHESGYSIQYPNIYNAQFGSLTKDQLILSSADDSNTIMIWSTPTTEQTLPTTLEDVSFPQPTEDFSFAGVEGKKYIYQMCDGPDCSPDIVSVDIIHNSIHYSIRFYGDKILDDTEMQILRSFEFVK